MKEEYGLRAFDNRLQKKVFRPKGIVAETWRKLHIEELHTCSPNSMA
jgi:hypothetical protein